MDDRMKKELKEMFEVLREALDPTVGLSEEQKNQLDTLKIAHDSMNYVASLRRIADRADGKVKMDAADIFAAGILHQLADENALKSVSRTAMEMQKEVVAHWLRLFQNYSEGKEL